MSDRQGGGQGQELARGGGLGEPYVSDSNSIPTLRMGASPRKGKALRQQLRVLVDRLKASQWRGPSRRRFGTKAAHGSRGRGSNLAGAHASPYDNPHHTEKYDQVMEQRKWDALARKFRQEHPDMDPATEQKQLDALWRKQYPYHYHAYGPKTRRTPSKPSPAAPPSHRPPARSRSLPPLVYPPAPPTTGAGWEGDSPPDTVLAPAPEKPDFNGQSAVIARLPRLGNGPSQLDEYQKETRGSFAVRVFGASGQPEIEVTRAWGCCHNEKLGFKCTYRGYRELTADHAGNTVVTGFKRVWTGKRRILTGMSIPPTGNPKEFDIMTCRDLDNGEVQYFKLRPELLMARMRERYCEGDIPSGSIGGCAW